MNIPVKVYELAERIASEMDLESKGIILCRDRNGSTSLDLVQFDDSAECELVIPIEGDKSVHVEALDNVLSDPMLCELPYIITTDVSYKEIIIAFERDGQ